MPFFSRIILRLFASVIAARIANRSAEGVAPGILAGTVRAITGRRSIRFPGKAQMIGRNGAALSLRTAERLRLSPPTIRHLTSFGTDPHDSSDGSDPVQVVVYAYSSRAGLAPAVPPLTDATAAYPKIKSQLSREPEHLPVSERVRAASLPVSSTRRRSWRSKRPAFTSCPSLGAAPT